MEKKIERSYPAIDMSIENVKPQKRVKKAIENQSLRRGVLALNEKGDDAHIESKILQEIRLLVLDGTEDLND